VSGLVCDRPATDRPLNLIVFSHVTVYGEHEKISDATMVARFAFRTIALGVMAVNSHIASLRSLFQHRRGIAQAGTRQSELAGRSDLPLLHATRQKSRIIGRPQFHVGMG
jgi:hypothetical protein